MDIYLIRHGKTPGNVRKAYVGITDESLTEEGRNDLKSLPPYPQPKVVYVTPLRRTQETAEILFPGISQEIVPQMREMDFGIFEGKNYEDLADDPDYKIWVDGDCEGVCPQGEGIVDFAEKVCKQFIFMVNQAILSHENSITFVVHGGVIMSLAYCLSTTKKDFYQWWIENGKCFHFAIDPRTWENTQKMDLISGEFVNG